MGKSDFTSTCIIRCEQTPTDHLQLHEFALAESHAVYLAVRQVGVQSGVQRLGGRLDIVFEDAVRPVPRPFRRWTFACTANTTRHQKRACGAFYGTYPQQSALNTPTTVDRGWMGGNDDVGSRFGSIVPGTRRLGLGAVMRTPVTCGQNKHKRAHTHTHAGSVNDDPAHTHATATRTSSKVSEAPGGFGAALPLPSSSSLESESAVTVTMPLLPGFLAALAALALFSRMRMTACKAFTKRKSSGKEPRRAIGVPLRKARQPNTTPTHLLQPLRSFAVDVHDAAFGAFLLQLLLLVAPHHDQAAGGRQVVDVLAVCAVQVPVGVVRPSVTCAA